MKKILFRSPFILFFMGAAFTTIETRGNNLPDSIPKGWRAGPNNPADIIIGTDRTVRHSGKASGFVQRALSLKPSTGSGVLFQSIAADPYRNKRVRLSVYVRSNDVESREGPGPFLYFGVYGTDSVLTYANTMAKMIEETTDWTLYHITLDVPETSVSMEFGMILLGQGMVWVDDYKLEAVELSIPSDDWIYKQKSPKPVKKMNYRPNAIATNLGFDDK